LRLKGCLGNVLASVEEANALGTPVDMRTTTTSDVQMIQNHGMEFCGSVPMETHFAVQLLWAGRSCSGGQLILDFG
jgi:hypothetical protein